MATAMAFTVEKGAMSEEECFMALGNLVEDIKTEKKGEREKTGGFQI